MKNKEYLIEYEEIPNHPLGSAFGFIIGFIILILCLKNWSFIENNILSEKESLFNSLPAFIYLILVVAFIGFIIFGGWLIITSSIEFIKREDYDREGKLREKKEIIYGTSIKEIKEVIYPNQKRIQKQEKIKYKTIFRGKDETK